MAGEVELETLLVRIKGDGSLYQRSLEGAQAQTQRFASGVSSALSMVAKSFVALGAMHYLKEWLGEWRESEKVTKQLTAIVQLNDRAVKETMASYTEFADIIQKQTKYSDESALSMLRQAEAFGLTGDAAKAAVQNAIALGALKGTDASMFLRMTIAAQQGNAALLLSSRGIGAFVKDAKTDAEKLAKVQEMLRKGFELAQVGGGMAKLKNAISDVKEDLGKVVAQYIDPLVVGLTTAARWAKGISEETKKAVVNFMMVTAVGLAIVPAFLALKAVAIPLFVGIGFVAAIQLGYVGKLFKWLGDTFAITGKGIQDTWKGIGNAFKAGDLNLAWDIVMAQIRLSFAQSLVKMGEMWISFTSNFDRGLNLFSTNLAKGFNVWMYKVGAISFEEGAQRNRILNEDSKAANEAINKQQMDNLKKWSAETRDALQDLEKRKQALLNLSALNAGKVAPPEMSKQPGFPDSLKKSSDKAETKIEAAAFGSAEAMTRIESHRDAKVDKTNGLLKDIKEILQDQGNDLELAPAGLG